MWMPLNWHWNHRWKTTPHSSLFTILFRSSWCILNRIWEGASAKNDASFIIYGWNEACKLYLNTYQLLDFVRNNVFQPQSILFLFTRVFFGKIIIVTVFIYLFKNLILYCGDIFWQWTCEVCTTIVTPTTFSPKKSNSQDFSTAVGCDMVGYWFFFFRSKMAYTTKNADSNFPFQSLRKLHSCIQSKC